MCGIAGIWELAGRSQGAAEVVRRMTNTLTHRGPDDEGYVSIPEKGVFFGHRRLSIVDLSPTGRQPMTSRCGRYVLVLNGEIYNHRGLRTELSGVPLRGTSDAEVFLELIARDGLPAALSKAVGMFAFALYDGEQRTLQLCRDRLGEKPLYYSNAGTSVLFASELKALREHSDCPADLSREAVEELLLYGYISGASCVLRGVHKVRPGTYVTLNRDGGVHESEYWSLRTAAERGVASRFAGSLDDATDALDQLLGQALVDQLEADVPVGAFLSGGIDSSCVVGKAQAMSRQPVRSFTVGFDHGEFDESPYARSVAEHLGTLHTEMRVDPATALALVPTLPDVFDEPMADSSHIPTLCVAQMTRQHVTVSISADGGDELFGGYRTYGWVPKLHRALSPIPYFLRSRLAPSVLSVLRSAPVRRIGTLRPQVLHRAIRIASLMSARRAEDLFERLCEHWEDAPLSVARSIAPPEGLSSRERLQYLDATRYLPDDVLTKVDRATMKHSLESRAPLLDHRIVEFAWSLDEELKYARTGEGKVPLRRVLDRYVPRALVDRPKAGFAVPLATWLRGGLRDWAESLLTPSAIEDLGFDPVLAMRTWEEHQTGYRDWKTPLFTLLTMLAWHRRWGGSFHG